MDADENKQLIRTIFNELASGKSRALLSRTAEDSKWFVIGSTPISGWHHSREDFYRNVLGRVTGKLTARVAPTVTHVHAEGDTVIVEWRGESVAKGGSHYNNMYCWVLTVRDGWIVEGRIYADTALIESVLS